MHLSIMLYIQCVSFLCKFYKLEKLQYFGLLPAPQILVNRQWHSMGFDCRNFIQNVFVIC